MYLSITLEIRWWLISSPAFLRRLPTSMSLYRKLYFRGFISTTWQAHLPIHWTNTNTKISHLKCINHRVSVVFWDSILLFQYVNAGIFILLQFWGLVGVKGQWGKGWVMPPSPSTNLITTELKSSIHSFQLKVHKKS